MAFHEASRYCYQWLKDQPFVKEESLTDWLLYYVSQQIPNVYYKAFKRNEEAFCGADWEWWIVTNGTYQMEAYRLLIQAKKLKKDGDNYARIAYSNQHGLQIDLLIEAAKKRRALPLYAYYSCVKPDINEQIVKVDYLSEELLRWCQSCTNGCFLASALAVQKNVFDCPKRKISEKELVDASFGLSLLDSIFPEKGGPQGLLYELNDYYRNLRHDDNHVFTGIRYNQKNLPTYVKTLIERHNYDNLSWYENEFRYDLGDLAGIVIVDTRSNNV